MITIGSCISVTHMHVATDAMALSDAVLWWGNCAHENEIHCHFSYNKKAVCVALFFLSSFYYQSAFIDY